MSIYRALNIMRQKYFFLKIFLFLVIAIPQSFSWAEEEKNEQQKLHIGYLGSLSGFAANYGNSVLEGVNLAIAQLKKEGKEVTLEIEDDSSEPKNTVTAYRQLVDLKKVDLIIAGSWWINSIVKIAEKQNIPIISCETLLNEDTVFGKNYFILGGDLKDWVRIYEPLIKEKNWKKGAIVRFISGFGSTLQSSMEEVFSKDGRKFVGAIQYSDVNASDVGTNLLKLKNLNPDVVYIDSQPAGLANILKRINNLGIKKPVYLINSALQDLLNQKLLPAEDLPQLYFSKRETYSPNFAKMFAEKYNKPPYLNADLGYYAVYLAERASASKDIIKFLKTEKVKLLETTFEFDSQNVFTGIKHDVWYLNKDRQAVLY